MNFLVLLVAAVLAYLAFIASRLGLITRLGLVLRPISIESIPDRAARRHGERPLFTCDSPPRWTVAALRDRYPDDTTWSAVRIQETIGFVAAAIRQLTVSRGDRVAILKENHFDIHLLIGGVVRAGAIACPINGRFGSGDVAAYLAHIDAKVLITDVVTAMRVMLGGGAFANVSTIVLASNTRSDEYASDMLDLLSERAPHAAVVWLEDALALIEQPVSAASRVAGEPLYLVHSSGTTGFPKAVILENGAQSHAIRGWLSYVHLSPSRDRGFAAVPNNHQAVILTFNSALLLGLPVHWNAGYTREDFNAERVANELASGGYTGFFAFPIAYTMLTEVDLDAHDLSRMRFWASTADAAHAVIERMFVARGNAFKGLGLPLRGSIYLDAQGSSEVGTPSVLRYLTRYTRTFDRRIGRRGSSPFGPKVRVTSDDRVIRAHGEVGRLEVKGRTVFAGYWNNHALTTSVKRDGWFFTGDVVRYSADRHIVQLDREVDVIHTSAGPVYSLPMEEKLHAHPAAFDLCVYGARQDDGTQAPAVAVALRTGSAGTAGELLREFNALLDAGEQLVRLDIIDWSEFPIGVTGKTLKRVFRERSECLIGRQQLTTTASHIDPRAC